MTADERLALLPPIRRAREFYLYDHRGRRYLDLAQNGGRAILGHRPNRLSTRLKNVLSSGLLAELPSVYGPRLERAVARLIGGPCSVNYDDGRRGCAVRWYQGAERARAAIAAVLGAEPGAVHDPVHPAAGGPAPAAAGDAGADAAGGLSETRRGEQQPAVVLWRPFLGGPDAAGAAGAQWRAAARVLLPVLPFPGAFAPQVVCFASTAQRRPVAAGMAAAQDPPASDLVSPWLLAGLERAALALQQDPRAGGAPAWPQTRSVQRRGSGRLRVPNWAGFESSLWRRVGPYLLWTGEEALPYDEVFRRFLEAGFLLSPEREAPSIIPGRCSHGEFARFVALCREVEEGGRC